MKNEKKGKTKPRKKMNYGKAIPFIMERTKENEVVAKPIPSRSGDEVEDMLDVVKRKGLTLQGFGKMKLKPGKNEQGSKVDLHGLDRREENEEPVIESKESDFEDRNEGTIVFGNQSSLGDCDFSNDEECDFEEDEEDE